MTGARWMARIKGTVDLEARDTHKQWQHTHPPNHAGNHATRTAPAARSKFSRPSTLLAVKRSSMRLHCRPQKIRGGVFFSFPRCGPLIP